MKSKYEKFFLIHTPIILLISLVLVLLDFDTILLWRIERVARIIIWRFVDLTPDYLLPMMTGILAIIYSIWAVVLINRWLRSEKDD